MPLPNYVVPNEPVESAWGNSVVDNLSELHDELALRAELFAVGSASGATTNVDTTWQNLCDFGNVTIPSGVSYIVATVASDFVVSALAATFGFRLTIGGTAPAAYPVGALLCPASERLSIVRINRFTGISAGSAAVKLQAYRYASSGTGTLAFDYPVADGSVSLRCYG